MNESVIQCISSYVYHQRDKKKEEEDWERESSGLCMNKEYVLILSLIIGVSRSCIIFEDVLCVFTAFTLFIVIPKRINVF